jgi:glycosyltransferase involved in cell wall biosynthesis
MNLASAVPQRPVNGPLVSIIMTAYQAGRRIVPAISSLLEQSYRDIEVIVVDDASTDETGNVVRALAARDPRVIYVRLPRNVGTYVAKSVGLRHASGEFVTCHDSDDWSHPLRIERQVRPLLENRHIVFTTSYWVRVQDDGVYYARPVNPLMRLNPASPMFRKDMVLKHAGGWDTVRTGADSEFAARLTLVFGHRARHRVVQPLAFGAHRPGSLMTAADTGYSKTGMSPTRLAYWESWGHYHINELRAGRRPYISPDLLAERRFAVPDAIAVPRQDIEMCLG